MRKPLHSRINPTSMQEPFLYAVVAVSAPSESWVTTPPQPWPSFVRLSSETPDTEVALVVHVLATYNALETCSASWLSPGEIISEECLVLPGGLAVIAGDKSIFPGCCSGLEEWPEWESVLSGSGGPFLGHNPAPFIVPSASGFLVWSDGGLDSCIPADAFSIGFSRQRLREALALVNTDLVGFLSRLHVWATRTVPDHAVNLVSAFARAFHIPTTGSST